MTDRPPRPVIQNRVRRFGASFALVAAALLLARYVTPSGASSPLVLLGATAAVAYFGGRGPAIASAIVAVLVNAGGIGLDELPRLALESSMMLTLGAILAFRVSSTAADQTETREPVYGDVVVNRPEIGATQEVPALEDAGQEREASATETVAVMTDSDSSTGPRVLVIQGNAVLRLALRSTLGGLGYAVSDVANPAAAEPLLSETSFDAVVIDVGRVSEASIAAVDRIRQSSRIPVGKLLALVQGDNEGEHELLKAAGADCVAVKPIDTVGVASKLRNLIAARQPTGQSRVGLGASP